MNTLPKPSGGAVSCWYWARVDTSKLSEEECYRWFSLDGVTPEDEQRVDWGDDDEEIYLAAASRADAEALLGRLMAAAEVSLPGVQWSEGLPVEES